MFFAENFTQSAKHLMFKLLSDNCDIQTVDNDPRNLNDNNSSF